MTKLPITDNNEILSFFPPSTNLDESIFNINVNNAILLDSIFDNNFNINNIINNKNK